MEHENPFSTCCVRPGAIPYRFPPGEDVDGLVRRLRANGWRGQIVGPHGTGKSALLATLLAAIEQSGCRTHVVRLHDGQRRLTVPPSRIAGLEPGMLFVVDGYEQLSCWNRFRLRRFCRRRKLGLLVTAHGPVGLPDLFRTSTNVELVRQLVDHLAAVQSSFVSTTELEERFAAQRGNVRELLFDLYDLYEQRRRDIAIPEPAESE